MPKKPDSFEAVLANWSTPTEMSEALGIPYVTAQVMRHRKSISAVHWPAVIKCLKANGITVTTDDLLAMQFKRAEERRAEREGQAA